MTRRVGISRRVQVVRPDHSALTAGSSHIGHVPVIGKTYGVQALNQRRREMQEQLKKMESCISTVILTVYCINSILHSTWPSEPK